MIMIWTVFIFLALNLYDKCNLVLAEDSENLETYVLNELFSFDEYNKEARPATEDRFIIKVNHSLSLNRLISLRDDLLVIDAWQVISWFDPRLQWNKKYYKISSLNLDTDRIWKPDIVNFNNAGGNSGFIYEHLPLIVYHNGLVIWVPPTRLTSHCKPQGDVFHCPWTFGSWTHDSSKLVVDNVLGNIDMSEYEESSRIEIISTGVSTMERKYRCCPESYSIVSYNITIKWKDADVFHGLEPMTEMKYSSNVSEKAGKNIQNDEHSLSNRHSGRENSTNTTEVVQSEESVSTKDGKSEGPNDGITEGVSKGETQEQKENEILDIHQNTNTNSTSATSVSNRQSNHQQNQGQDDLSRSDGTDDHKPLIE